jgi:hypothetical protein
MRTMITICAKCKKELRRTVGPAIERTCASLFPDEEIVYSHGICYDCGVTLYGSEIVQKVDAKLKLSHPVQGAAGPKIIS